MYDPDAESARSLAAFFGRAGVEWADLSPDCRQAFEGEQRRRAVRKGCKPRSCYLCGAALRARGVCRECGVVR